MKIEERQNRILDILQSEKTIEVGELASRLNTSLVTIRKDLTTLEQKKLLVRERGCARLNNDNLMAVSMSTHYAVKKKIAERASCLVESGETIMVESGSTCVLLADELARSGKQVTIITNSVFLAEYTGHAANLDIILTGGNFLASSEAMVGPAARTALSAYHARWFFTGADGFSPESGFTGDSLQKAEIIREMAGRSDTTVVMAEKARFTRQGAVSILDKEIHTLVIVDALPDDSVCQILKQQGAELVVA